MKLIKKFLLAALLALLSVHAFSKDLTPQETTTVAFYKWYLGELVDKKEPFDVRNDRVLKRFLAPALIAKVRKLYRTEESGRDYFIKAQDFADAWKDNVTTRVTETEGEESTVIVKLTDNDFASTIAVQLRQNQGAWKIINALNINE